MDINLQNVVNRAFDAEDNSQGQRDSWLELLTQFRAKYGRCSDGNRLTLFDEGDAAYKEIFRNIDNSRMRVWLEVYVFDDSFLAETMVYKLRDASKRGCDVILLVDSFGAYSMKPKWIESLRHDGVTVLFFNPVTFGLGIPTLTAEVSSPADKGNSMVVKEEGSVGSIFFRDHRKILICDNVAFTGSMNVSADAAGNNYFYDIHVKVEGPAVADIADVFRDSLAESRTGIFRDAIERTAVSSNNIHCKDTDSYCYLQVLESNVRTDKRQIQSVVEAVLNQASRSICLTTGYFLPPGFLRRSLINATKSSIPLSILISGNSDVFATVPASKHVLQKVLKLPSKTTSAYITQTQHCHAKALVVDDVWSEVGTFNWDRYSSRRNLEVELAVFDRSFALRLRRSHEKRAMLPTTHKQKNWNSVHPLMRLYWFACYNIARISDGLSNKRYKAFLRRVLVHKYLEETAGANLATSMMWGLE